MSDRDACWSGADHRHLDAVFRGTAGREVFAVNNHPVGKESLQQADGHRPVFFAANTGALALKFMGADPGTDGRHGAGFTDGPVGLFELTP